MKHYFDTVLDPFNFKTASKNRAGMNIDIAIKWYMDSSTRHAHSLMGDLRGKRVLDVGCGIGTHLVWLARNGAEVTGIDVSEKRVYEARRLAKNEGLEDRISVYLRDAEKSGFPDESFDLIYGQDVLMYFEGTFGPFINEMRRVLKSGGSFIFVEPLDGHPVARFYRKYIAPKDWKIFTHNFGIRYLEDFRQAFGRVEYKTFYLFGFFVYALKVYTPFYGLFSMVDGFLNRIDSAFMKAFPGSRRFGWRIVLSARK